MKQKIFQRTLSLRLTLCMLLTLLPASAFAEEGPAPQETIETAETETPPVPTDTAESPDLEVPVDDDEPAQTVPTDNGAEDPAPTSSSGQEPSNDTKPTIEDSAPLDEMDEASLLTAEGDALFPGLSPDGSVTFSTPEKAEGTNNVAWDQGNVDGTTIAYKAGNTGTNSPISAITGTFSGIGILSFRWKYAVGESDFVTAKDDDASASIALLGGTENASTSSDWETVSYFFPTDREHTVTWSLFFPLLLWGESFGPVTGAVQLCDVTFTASKVPQYSFQIDFDQTQGSIDVEAHGRDYYNNVESFTNVTSGTAYSFGAVGEGQTAADGTKYGEIVATATPVKGYSLEGWYIGDERIGGDDSLTYPVPDAVPVILQAKFTQNLDDISTVVTETTGGSIALQNDADIPWIVDTRFTGGVTIRSNNQEKDSASTVTATVTAGKGGTYLAFDYTCSTGYSQSLEVTVDGKEALSATGNRDITEVDRLPWLPKAISLTEGEHTVQFTYQAKGTAGGMNTAWLSDLRLTDAPDRINVTVTYNDALGSVKVNGTPVSSGVAQECLAGENVSLGTVNKSKVPLGLSATYGQTGNKVAAGTVQSVIGVTFIYE